MSEKTEPTAVESLAAWSEHEDLDATPDPTLREQLSNLHGLLLLAMLMTESGEDHQILHLAATAVPSFGRSHLSGIYLGDDGWLDFAAGTAHTPVSREEQALVKGQLALLAGAGGPVAISNVAWAWAFALRSLEGDFGYLVASADETPGPHEQFLLRVLAQQVGIALANARSHRRERAAASALRLANARLADTVAALERSTATHARLTQVAVAGEGQDGIARALHELTGFPVAIEDRHGNLVSWAGPDQPQPYPKDSAARREELLDQMRAGTVVRRHGRMICVARPRGGVVGLIALIDPEGRCGDAEEAALEHGATILAMELARAHSVAEAELRLGRDLAEELLAGSDEAISLTRATALGYDLYRPHRVVVVRYPDEAVDADQREHFFHAVRRAARDSDVGSLQVSRQGAVVVLCQAHGDWVNFLAAIVAESGGGASRLAVGGRCERPVDFPRSHREARLALSLQVAAGLSGDPITVFDELGLFRILLSVADTSGIEQFVEETLGLLVNYDARRGSEMVKTLTVFLECGGNYDTTARELSVHRSTLKYRLQRIGEISGHELSAPDVRFNLQLATRAAQSLQALRRPSS
jgi:sugar diacid utilization regulator